MSAIFPYLTTVAERDASNSNGQRRLPNVDPCRSTYRTFYCAAQGEMQEPLLDRIAQPVEFNARRVVH